MERIRKIGQVTDVHLRLVGADIEGFRWKVLGESILSGRLTGG